MRTSRKFYSVMTPLERVVDSLSKFVDEHPAGCHCSACYSLRQVQAQVELEGKMIAGIRVVFETLMYFEEDATEAKRMPIHRNEPEMHYQQGRADAFRIAMMTCQEHFTRDQLGRDGL